MTYWVFLPLVAILVNAFFWTFVFAQPRKTRLNKAYLMLAGAFIMWGILEVAEQTPLDAAATFIIAKLVPVSWGFLGFTSIHFTYALLDRKRDWVYFASLAAFFIVLAASSATDLVLEGLERTDWGTREVDGPLAIYLIIIAVAVPALYSLFLILRERRRSTGASRRILGSILVGSSITVFFGLLFEVALPRILGPTPFELGSYTTVFMAFFVHRAVVQHNFLKVGVEEAAVEIFENSAFGIVISDAKTGTISLNNEARRIVDAIASLEGVTHDSAIGALTGSGDEESIQDLSFGSAEAPLHIQSHSTPIYKQDSSAGLVAILRDITAETVAAAEKTRLEDHVRQTQKLESLGTLAGGIAHDMNNILTGILGSTSVLMSEFPAGTEQAADLLSILQSARRGKDLTGNLLGFARKTKFAKQRVSLNSAAQEVLPMLKRTVSKSIEIEYRSDGNLLDIEADAGQLSQLIVNLCLNGIDAIEGAGKITISTHLAVLPDDGAAVALPPGNYARLTVEDDGTGMDEEIRSKIFEPFFTTKDAGKGTGLGMAMVYGTVKNHEGEIDIASSPGDGTRVNVYLPLLSLAERASLAPSVGEIAPEVSRDICALVVDDEQLVRRTARRILEKLGCRVFEATNGQEALDIYREIGEEIDLVLLDLSMPVMGGGECFRELKKIDPDAWIVISSGFSHDPDAEGLMEAGAADFLSKPYEMSHLRKVISTGRAASH